MPCQVEEGGATWGGVVINATSGGDDATAEPWPKDILTSAGDSICPSYTAPWLTAPSILQNGELR